MSIIGVLGCLGDNMTTKKRVRMPSKNLGVDVKAVCASVDAGKLQASNQVEKKRRKYRSKSVLLDSFFISRRNAEIVHGLIIGLDKCSGLSEEGGLSPKSYLLHVNAVPFRLDTLIDCTNFLNGICYGLTLGRGAETGLGSGSSASVKVEKMIG